MKTLKNVIIIAIIVITCYIAYRMYTGSNDARLIEIEKSMTELNEKIQKISNDCDSLKQELEIVKCNTDTLKKGQAVIYNEVKKSNESFLSKLF